MQKEEKQPPSPDSLHDGEATSGVKTPKGHATPDLGTARGPHSRPKTPDVTKAGQSSALACFGLGSGTTLDDRQPGEPKGIVGLQNVGEVALYQPADYPVAALKHGLLAASAVASRIGACKLGDTGCTERPHKVCMLALICLLCMPNMHCPGCTTC